MKCFKLYGLHYSLIIRVHPRVCFGFAQHDVERSGRFYDSFSQHSGMSLKIYSNNNRWDDISDNIPGLSGVIHG